MPVDIHCLSSSDNSVREHPLTVQAANARDPAARARPLIGTVQLIHVDMAEAFEERLKPAQTREMIAFLALSSRRWFRLRIAIRRRETHPNGFGLGDLFGSESP